ncbi:antibiotic biosynthesis monooxygenase family protein [Kitasatospora sp. A2-31]|uniref:putative quinol monooxygenase n=1 Tax=Kitasatospora sp. A2-31 TaxID=2916414 RepID=UPI001EEC33EF|nr:antibiotic biosynthesis monooxygenase family protein [Kitasatospora sp. A2-31]MCG6494423.1 antibiotic biosynthesis monooxygenase [Kitasatospora sp. A2-31]
MSLVVIADWLADTGAEQRVADLLPAVTEAALAEPGVLSFRVVRSLRDRAAFVVFAEYEDESALVSHRESGPYQDLVLDGITPLLIDRQAEAYALV